MVMHALWRALVLIALRIFLRPTHSAMTYFTFEDTLTQIGLGYPIAFLLAFTRPCWQWTALVVILAGYWAAWALYPAPGPHFDYAAVGVSQDWHYNFTGFLSHWNKNSNLGQAFDLWFLNLFRASTRSFSTTAGISRSALSQRSAPCCLGWRRGTGYVPENLQLQ